MSGEPDLSVLLQFPASTLRDFANGLRGGSLRHGITSGLIQPFFGARAGEVAQQLAFAVGSNGSPALLAAFVDVLADSQAGTESALRSVMPVLSGPAVPGVSVVSTPSMVRGLFEEAKNRVLVSSYVFHEARDLLAPLAKRMDVDPNFEVIVVTDLSTRRQGNEPLAMLANRFRAQFLDKIWSGSRAPEIWHDPRGVQEPDRSKSGVMHAKTVIIDETAALVTSANFTEAAQSRNIEVGILLRHSVPVKTLGAFFEGMMATGYLVKIG